MKRFKTNFVLPLSFQDANPLLRLLLMISTLIFLLPAILWLVFQLNHQRGLQQQILNSRITQHTIRHLAQLQRVHLRMYVLVAEGNERFDPVKVTEAKALVWSALRTLESPLYQDSWDSQTQDSLQEYRARWSALQPLLAEWENDPTEPETWSAVLSHMEEAEQLVYSLMLASHAHFEERLIIWAETSQRLNKMITLAIIALLILTLLVIYTLYHMVKAQAEGARVLEVNERRQRALLDSIPDAVLRVADNGVFIDVKPATHFVLPTPYDQLLQRNIRDVLPANVAGLLLQTIEETIATQQEGYCESTMAVVEDERVRNFETRVIPSGNAEVQLIMRDVTLDRQHEEQARQAQKLESLGVLAGGIAHDFNNLLTGILGQASLARLKLSKGGVVLDNIEKIVKSAEQAGDLTRQLLAYAGKGKFQISPLDLNQLIRDTTGLMHTAMPGSVELSLKLDERLPRVQADRGQLQQVIMNLFINAVEATKENGGSIEIKTHQQQVTVDSPIKNYVVNELDAGHYTVMQITDTGVGMDQAVLARIFDPFFSTKPQGHGLGLSATLGIIRTHRGGLHVQSQPGNGTTFIILLPALIEHPLDVALPVTEETASQGKQQTILVIDDEPAVREVASEILTEHGHTVVLAADGRAGVELFRLRHQQIDLVLLDMKMPGMDGRQTYQALSEIRRDVKVIFASGYSEVELSSQLADSTTLAFLHKPYTIEALMNMVEHILAK